MTAPLKYEKPLPIPDEATAPFWAATKKHELRIQKCSQCGAYRFPPRPICHKCRSSAFEWAKISDKGTVYSFIVVHQPTHAVFAPDGRPYAVVLVESDEVKGIRFAGNMPGYPVDKIEVGMKVQAVFDDVTDEITLVNWKPAK